MNSLKIIFHHICDYNTFKKLKNLYYLYNDDIGPQIVSSIYYHFCMLISD